MFTALSLLRWNKAGGGFMYDCNLFAELPPATASYLRAAGVPPISAAQAR